MIATPLGHRGCGRTRAKSCGKPAIAKPPSCRRGPSIRSMGRGSQAPLAGVRRQCKPRASPRR